MAVSSAALLRLNAKLFEETVDWKHKKFAYFFETLLTLLKERVPERAAAFDAMFGRWTARIDGTVAQSKEAYKTKDLVPPRNNARAYGAELEGRRSKHLREVDAMYIRSGQEVAEELGPLVPDPTIVRQTFWVARQMMRLRFYVADREKARTSPCPDLLEIM
jgi:hypothetical protein